jgi:membrane protein implicated in regulation of membrane protease activity
MHRVGIFLIWLGGILLLLYLISFQLQSQNILLLLCSLAAFILGTFLAIKTGKAPTQKSTRFRILRRNASRNQDLEEPDEEGNPDFQPIQSTRRKHF